MRMKFNKSGQLLLVSAASLLVAGVVTACSTLTVDFVFVTSAKAAGSNNYGEVDVFEVNSESGFMRQIPTSPFPSGGRNPVAAAVSTDYTNLYVVNRDDNTIVQFVIGNDGKLYPQNTVNTPGVYPLAVAVNGTNLFVLDTYQPLPTCSSAAPCSGSLAVFPVTVAAGSASNGALQTKTPINACNGLNYLPLSLTGAASGHVIAPTAVNVLANGSDVFISVYDTTANTGYVFGFSIGTLSCPNNTAPYTTIPTLTPLALCRGNTSLCNRQRFQQQPRIRHRPGKRQRIRLLSRRRSAEPDQRQPVPRGNSTRRHCHRFFEQVRIRGQLAGLLGYGLFHRQRRAHAAGNIRHRHPAGGHRHRSEHAPIPLHTQLSGKQHFRF
jgi:hypothetical protein